MALFREPFLALFFSVYMYIVYTLTNPDNKVNLAISAFCQTSAHFTRNTKQITPFMLDKDFQRN